jgi:dienelactone hydrolase
MLRAIIFLMSALLFEQASAQGQSRDSVSWLHVPTDSGTIHAAIAMPTGKGPFPAVIILHGTHGFADEYVKMARQLARNGIIGIAACWFAGRLGEGVRFITPIEFKDAPPLVDVPGLGRFRISRWTLDSLVRKVNSLAEVQPGNVMFFGHSRGAGAALDFVLTHPGKVKGLILNSCGYPPEVTKRAAEINIPVLMLHGTADSPADGGSAVTNISMANQFETALRSANKNVEANYYKDGGHNGIFTNSAQFEDTIQRMSKFMQNKLAK